jgi:glycosyltransferase involved in cell wall biosynthesis
VRIAQFSESFPPVINGVAVALDLLLEEMSRRHTLDVFAPRFRGFEDEVRESVRVHRFPAYTWPTQPDYPLALPVAPRASAAFRAARPEIVHTHSAFALGQTGRRWARRAGVPLVTTYHTLYVEYAHYAPTPRAWSRAFLKELSRAYCQACDAVVVPTAPIREVLLGYGVTRPIHVIPTGLKLRPPIPRDPEFPRGRFGIPPAAPMVLFAGRVAREKNLGLLLESFARAQEKVPEAWLLIAGNGPAEAEARQIAHKLPRGSQVVFAGFIAPEEMPRVYAGADLFGFTSLTDTQGLVLTEAKAAGLPVVSVDAYGPGAVVNDGVDGILCAPDTEALSQALTRLLTNPELRARMRENAFVEARRFSIEATAAAYEAIYADLIAADVRAAGGCARPSERML